MSEVAPDGLYYVGTIGNGRLWVGPRPKAKTLGTWSDALHQNGVTHVVSLIAEAEVERHQLENEGMVLGNHDIGFTHFPVDDFDVPDEGRFNALVADLNARLGRNETLFLHCAGGIGRAGTLASCLLIALGVDADEAMQTVSKARGVSVPETEAQAGFIRRFSV